MFSKIKTQFEKLTQFIKDLSNDPRIPSSDKTKILALVALVISPIDIIPDWIPILGQLDDLVIMAIILDYFFNVLDQEVILSHFPWGLTEFIRLKRWAGMISGLAPQFVTKRIWNYVGSPYSRR